MSSLRFLFNLTLVNYFLVAVYGSVNSEPSLIVTINDDELKLTLPYKYEKEFYFKIPENGFTYRFCPDYRKRVTEALYKTELLDPNSDVVDSNQCVTPIHSVFVEVENKEEIKNFDTNDNIELYHSGFLLSSRHVNISKEQTENDDTLVKTSTPIVKYKAEWDSDHKLFVQIEVFYDSNIERTAAVKYKLLSTILPYQKKNFEEVFFLLLHKVKEVPKLFAYYKSQDYMYKFINKLHPKWLRVIGNNFVRDSLSLSELASIYHFPLPTWETASRFLLNIVPLWRATKNRWNMVDKFALIVANNLGDLEITSGVTGIMTLEDEELIDPEGFKMPKYFWKAFEYYKENKIYGILVILHCNPYEKTEKKICEEVIDCKQNGWQVANADFRSGEIYCCEMKKENIKNLKADYLSLEKREIFNLNNWVEERMKILSQFVNVLRDFIK